MIFPVYYVNGNYQVKIKKDGTKVRTCFEEHFKAKRPETIDVNLSNYCENNCDYCYLAATKEGKSAVVETDAFFETIPPYTELAVNFFNKKDLLLKNLELFKKRKFITNLTIHWSDFINNKEWLLKLQEKQLVYGIGVSVTSEVDLKLTEDFEDLVFHTIAGITPITTFKKLKGKKVLILGFKTKGRTINKKVPDLKELKTELKKKLLGDWFEVLTFDNLAIEQLSLKKDIKKEVWEKYYLGAEGNASFYYGAVSKKAFRSSTEPLEKELVGKNALTIFKNLKECNHTTDCY